MRLAYLDTSTPLMRSRGQEQFDTAPFIRGMPALLPMFLRRSALNDLIARYYDFRSVVVDLLANLYSEGRPELVPWLTDYGQLVLSCRAGRHALPPADSGRSHRASPPGCALLAGVPRRAQVDPQAAAVMPDPGIA